MAYEMVVHELQTLEINDQPSILHNIRYFIPVTADAGPPQLPRDSEMAVCKKHEGMALQVEHVPYHPVGRRYQEAEPCGFEDQIAFQPKTNKRQFELHGLRMGRASIQP